MFESIQWNAVTWYSRLAAIIIFVGVLPVLDFYVGLKYQETNAALAESVKAETGQPVCPIIIKTVTQVGTTTTSAISISH